MKRTCIYRNEVDVENSLQSTISTTRTVLLSSPVPLQTEKPVNQWGVQDQYSAVSMYKTDNLESGCIRLVLWRQDVQHWYSAVRSHASAVANMLVWLLCVQIFMKVEIFVNWLGFLG